MIVQSVKIDKVYKYSENNGNHIQQGSSYTKYTNIVEKKRKIPQS